jgi:hypothetical protein
MTNKKYILYIRHSHCLCLMCLLAWCETSIAQHNLVKNGSFEQYNICPTYNNNSTPLGWYRTTNNLVSFYANSCSIDPCCGVPYNYFGTINYQLAKSGSGYIGLTLFNTSNEFRVYIQSKLIDSLKKNKNYFVEFYANLPNPLQFACNNISALFTKQPIYQDTINDPEGVILANPQVFGFGNPIITDTTNWVKISGIFKAQGQENYITLGNFKANSNTKSKTVNLLNGSYAGYLIDDVSVIPLDSFNLVADAGRDTTITVGDSVFIGSYTNGIDTLQWRNQNTSAVMNTQAPGFWVKPLTHTCYVLTQTVNGYTSSDTVCVTVNPLPLTMVNYKLLMVNEKQVMNNWLTANEINVSHYQIQRSVDSRNFETIGTVAAKKFASNEYSFVDELKTNDQYPKTLYYKLESIDKDGKQAYSQVKSINLQPSSFNINIFPNPTKGIINVTSSKGIKELKLMNTVGQLVKQIIVNETNNYQLSLVNPTLAKGLYLLQITTTTNEQQYYEKVIIE